MNVPITPEYIHSLKGRANEILQSTYHNELKEIDSLKTITGKKNRIDKFIVQLSEYYNEFEFSDLYSDIINSLNNYKNNFENILDLYLRREKMYYMSLILGYANKDNAIIMSDGRAGENGSLSEFYNKTRKINDNIIIGFAGFAEPIEFFLIIYQQN